MQVKSMTCMTLLSAVFISFNVSAEVLSCQEKVQELELKIKFAQDAGYTAKEAGLKRSLDRVLTYCNDADQLEIAKEEVQEKTADLEEAKEELLEKESELRESIDSGDFEDIKDIKEEVDEKKDDVFEKQLELNQAIDSYKKLKSIVGV